MEETLTEQLEIAMKHLTWLARDSRKYAGTDAQWSASRALREIEALRSVETKPESLTAEDGGMEKALKVALEADEKHYIDFHTRAYKERGNLVAKRDDDFDRGFKAGHRSRDGEVADLCSRIAIMESRASQFESTVKETIRAKGKLTSKLERMESAYRRIEAFATMSPSDANETLLFTLKELRQALKDEDGRE